MARLQFLVNCICPAITNKTVFQYLYKHGILDPSVLRTRLGFSLRVDEIPVLAKRHGKPRVNLCSQVCISDSDCNMDNPPPGCNLTPGDEKRIMQEFIEYAQNSTKQGDTYYVVSLRIANLEVPDCGESFSVRFTLDCLVELWWKEWKDYVEQDASAMHKSRPQSIDNSDLLLDVMEEDCITEPDLRESLLEGKDFILLPQTAWKLIHKW
eukprot:Gb_00783 [translate_table: standard]